MTYQEINIKIAEACGWEYRETTWDGTAYGRWKGQQGPLEGLPDYCTDLNAMHEAEKAFAADDRFYRRQLATVVKWPYQGALYNATARQRAEAFLRTIGKWEEQ